MIRTVLADDHEVIRNALRTLLEEEEDIIIVGEAGGGLKAIELVEKLQPDVIVLDLAMPEVDGFDVMRRIRKSSSLTRVVILSAHDDEVSVIKALKSGAIGYVKKTSSTDDLVSAIRKAVINERFLSSAISHRVIEALIRKVDTDKLDPHSALTDREREIVQLAADGRNNKEIGSVLSISPRTAQTHKTNIMRKLGLKNQAELIRYALQKGIISLLE